MRLFLSLSLLFALAACATPYGKDGLTGGYSDSRLAPNVFKVTFEGNGYTNKQRAGDLALLRGAELTLDHGFKYFVVIDGRVAEQTYQYYSPERTETKMKIQTQGNVTKVKANSYTYGGHVYNITTPSAENTIMAFKKRPQKVFSYDALYLYRKITEKYKIKPKY